MFAWFNHATMGGELEQPRNKEQHLDRKQDLAKQNHRAVCWVQVGFVASNIARDGAVDDELLTRVDREPMSVILNPEQKEHTDTALSSPSRAGHLKRKLVRQAKKLAKQDDLIKELRLAQRESDKRTHQLQDRLVATQGLLKVSASRDSRGLESPSPSPSDLQPRLVRPHRPLSTLSPVRTGESGLVRAHRPISSLFPVRTGEPITDFKSQVVTNPMRATILE